MPTLNKNKISPCLWFDHQAEEAATFYTSVFKHSKIGAISRYTDAGKEVHGRTAGTVMTVAFELEGLGFTALNGGPDFKFTEAISLEINCADQQEIDYFWEKLSAGGDEKAQQCGWLKDRFGVSWQVVSPEIAEMFADPDQAKTGRAMTAMLKMKKLDLAALRRAFEGKS